MKSCTDIVQSKILVKILPIESSDMWYSYYGNPTFNQAIAYKGEQWFLCHNRLSLHTDIPAWSLTALLNVLPSSTIDSSDDHHFRIHCKGLYTEWHDNPVDACYELILKLHELNLL